MTSFDSATTRQPRPINLPGREGGEFTEGFREGREGMGVLLFWQRLWFHWNEIVFAVAVAGAHPLVFFSKASLLPEMASPEPCIPGSHGCMLSQIQARSLLAHEQRWS